MAPRGSGVPRAPPFLFSDMLCGSGRARGLVRGFMSFLDVESIEELDPHRRCRSMNHHSRDMRVSLRLPAQLSIYPRSQPLGPISPYAL